MFDRHDLWEVLRQQVAEGKVRHLGMSLGGDVDHARRATDVGVSVVQVGYNRLDRTAEQGVLPGQGLGKVLVCLVGDGWVSGPGWM